MHFLRHVIRPYLAMRLYFHKITASGPFGPDSATYLNWEASTTNGNQLKNALFNNYIKQFHESSCSVASVVTIINALGTLQQSDFQPITQMDILNKVRTGHWKERMGPNGHNGRRGLPLMLLREVTEASLIAYGLDYTSVSAVQVVKSEHRASPIKKLLIQRLEAFECGSKGLMIAHFDQGVYVKSENIPHISPVGGFDPQTQKVTILDVDRHQKSPYKISLDTFYAGMASNYHHLFRPFGYGSGGYIWIKL